MLQILLLAFWIILGIGFRFTHLANKPPWNDEISTLGFSLGNSFYPVPTDRPIDLDTLLQPLRPSADATVSTVMQRLLEESTHPPLYFVLNHLWLQHFPLENGVVSVWASRSLSALWGAAAIPALFGLGWFAFRSIAVGQVAAGLMAVSPFGVYLAQEARHYTLVILLMIASLAGLISWVRSITAAHAPRLITAFLWILVNSLGMATHYFFGLLLLAEGCLLLVWLYRYRQPVTRKTLTVVTIALVGSTMGTIVWLPVLSHIPSNQLTHWIFADHLWTNFLGTIARWSAWIITMVALLPVEEMPLWVQIPGGAVVLMFMGWLIKTVTVGLRQQLQARERTVAQTLLSIWLILMIAFAAIVYGLGADLTIAARYHFLYFPIILLLIAAAFVPGKVQQRTIALTIIMGILGSLTVVSNLGYQKPDRPDDLWRVIDRFSSQNILIANYHENHEQTREMIGLGLELYRDQQRQTPLFQRSAQRSPRFLLAHEDTSSRSAVEVVQKVVNQQSEPFDLWLFNFFPTPEPTLSGCTLDPRSNSPVDGYKHRFYHCLGRPSI